MTLPAPIILTTLDDLGDLLGAVAVALLALDHFQKHLQTRGHAIAEQILSPAGDARPE